MKITQKPSNLFLFVLPGVSIICGFCIGYILLHFFYLGDEPEVPANIIVDPSQYGWISAVIIATVGIAMIIYQKRVSLLWSIFFLSLPISTFLIPIFDADWSHPLFRVAYWSISAWGLGWLILFRLKTKRVSPAVEEAGNEESAPTHLKWSKADLTVFSVILLIIGFGVLAGNSYGGIDIGYSEYETEIVYPGSNANVRFEYPVCFQKYIDVDGTEPLPLTEGDNLYLNVSLDRMKRELLRPSGFTWIEIIVIDLVSEGNTSLAESSESSILDKMLAYNGGPKYCRYLDLIDTGNITVSGIQAEYIVASYQGALSYIWRSDGSEYMRFVNFKHGGSIWQISMRSVGPETERHVEFFNHLLKTMTITPLEVSSAVLTQ